MLRFQIYGETPSKKNSKIFTKSGKLIPSKVHQAWHDYAIMQINQQLVTMGAERPHAITEPVSVTLTFYHGDQVRRDSDNQTASIMDLLQKL